MATSEEIAFVMDLLGPDAGASGWDPDRVEVLLDSGDTPNDIAVKYWRVRAAATSRMVDVTESGSSRKLSDIHKNALAMAAMYEKASGGSEDDEPAKPVSARTRPIRRV